MNVLRVVCELCIYFLGKKKKSDCVKFVLQASSSYLIMWVSVDVLSAVIIIVIFVVQRWVHSPPFIIIGFVILHFINPLGPRPAAALSLRNPM